VTLAAQILDADDNAAATEAAWTILREAADLEDAQLLLDALGLQDVTWSWDIPRTARHIIVRARHGQQFSADTLRPVLPARARPLISNALQALARAGLAAATGTIRSAAPAARGRRICLWQLTPAGTRLAAEAGPLPGEIHVSSLNTLNGGV